MLPKLLPPSPSPLGGSKVKSPWAAGLFPVLSVLIADRGWMLRKRVYPVFYQEEVHI